MFVSLKVGLPICLKVETYPEAYVKRSLKCKTCPPAGEIGYPEAYVKRLLKYAPLHMPVIFGVTGWP